MTAAHPIVGIGEFLWDLFPKGYEPGGAIGNVAQHVHAMGENAILVSRVGNDPLGEQFFKLWKEHGLDASYVTIDDARPTGTVIVTQHANGDATYKTIPQVASDYIPFTSSLGELALRTDAVCFGTFAQWEEPSRHAIQRFLDSTGPQCLRLFDINLRPHRWSQEMIASSLKRATVLKTNDEELAVLTDMFALQGDTRQQLQQLITTFDLELIALTRGSKGSLLLTKTGDTHDHPGIPTKVVDTVGAGDAFTACMAVGLRHHMPLAKLNDFANRVGSFICTQVGATAPLPAALLAMLS